MIDTKFVADPRAEKLRAVSEMRVDGIMAVLGAPDDSDVATRNVLAGEFIVTGSKVYKAMCNIPNGAELVEGVNVIRTTVEEQLNALQEGE